MKVKAFWSILVLSLVLLLGGCAPAATPAETPPLVGCKAEVSDIYLLQPGLPLLGIQGGSDLLGLIMEFTISNPNPYQVSVEGLTYKLDTGQGADFYEEIPYRYFIPAGEEITLQGVGSLFWMAICMDKLMNKGLSAGQSVGAAVPVWKGLGGIRPGMVPKEAWDALEAQPVTYSFETSIYTRAQGMQAWESVKGEW